MTASVSFFSAGGPTSGVAISGLGTSEFCYIGFYGAGGFSGLISVGEAQTYTWITSSGSLTAPDNGTSASGEMTNNKWVDASGVSMSGGDRKYLTEVISSDSGTFIIRVSDTGNFNIQNARLYAYDGNDVNNSPSGCWVYTREIIPTSYVGTSDTQWALTDATNYNYFVDRNSFVGYAAATTFDYFVGVSVRPKLNAASGITRFAFYFVCDIV